MADRIIKGDSGNDVIIQNNAGSRKIEVTNSGNIEFVGDLAFTGDTDSKFKLPSSGGIHESDGSTEILTESGGAVTLKNTNIDITSIGTGQLIKAEFYVFIESSDFDLTSTSFHSVRAYQSFSCTVGSTIIFNFSFLSEVFRSTGTIGERRGMVRVKQSTSAVSGNITSSLGTTLNELVIGRNLIGASSSSATGYIPTFIQGSFVATNSTHYLGLNSKTLNTDNTYRVTTSGDRPLTLSIYEYKGDVLT